MSMDYSPSSSGRIGSSALTRTLLQNYTLRIKNLEDEFSMEEVPAEIRNFFVPYVRHMQAIDNIAYCLNNLFRANEPILNAFNSLYYQLNDLTGTFKKNLDELTNNLIDNLAPPIISEPTMQTRSNRKTFDVSHVANIVKERRCVNKLKNPGRRGRKPKLNGQNTADKGLTLNDENEKLKWGQVISRTPVCQIRDVILGRKSKNEENGSTEKGKNCEYDLHRVSEGDSIWNEFNVLVPKEEPPSLEEDIFSMQPSVTLTKCKNHSMFPELEKRNSMGLKTNVETHNNYPNANNKSTFVRNVISNCVENHTSVIENFATSDKPALSTENLLFDDENLILVHIVGYANPFCFKSKKSANSITRTYVAGCGVWFNHNHSLNVSVPMRDGAPCSYSAEIEAAILAINQANDIGIKKIKLRTSSKFLYKCLTKWIGTYKQNNWSTRMGAPVKNKERLMKLDKLLSLMDVVDLEYIKERKNIVGFQGALELAKSATLIKKESI